MFPPVDVPFPAVLECRTVQSIDLQQERDTLLRAARVFDSRGWLLGTSGNLSYLVSRDPLRFCISNSGGQKGELTPADLLLVGPQREVFEGAGRPSAETLVHEVLYRKFDAGAIFHVHSVKAAVMSEACAADHALTVSGIEMIKGLDIWEPDAVVRIPVVENHADIPELARAVGEVATARVPGVLVRNHGIYGWGKNCAEARRHVEVIEYLCDYSYTMALLRRPSND